MTDLQSKKDAHQHDIARAKEQIHDATQKADSYLSELTKRVDEYEKNHSSFAPAGKYLKSALDASRSATQKLKTQGQDLSERSVPVAIDGMKAVRESLDDLQQQAVMYDEKYTGAHGKQTLENLQHYVNVGRQRATDAMETTNEQLMKLRDAIGSVAGQAQHGAQVVVGEAMRAVEFGDEKLGVTDKAGGVVQKVRELDARLGVTATVAKVDTKITGGLGCKVAATTVEIVSESVTYISETLHNAKLAAQHSEAARSVEAKGATVAGAAVTKKNEVQTTFNEAYEKGKDKAGMATEKTEEKAKDMANQAKQKTVEVKEQAAEKVDQAKEKTNMAKNNTTEIAGQVKNMAQDKADKTEDKTSEVKDKTQQKISENSKEVVGQVGDVKDKAMEQLGIGTAKGMPEEKTTKAKSTTIQDETTAEQALDAIKKIQLKESEAAKTSVPPSKKHGKHAK
ncbi:hypothetical protein PHMEG_0004214 [Phytophthora megakarya]|uniref:Uncharacterized protein n=1 Tax=Phytophthora megakarya TaxID=4795 RepID=A0A225WUC5_9STRA|nr:hypothetical protein PHMEG_0004214 [Phytophthora megakarya]